MTIEILKEEGNRKITPLHDFEEQEMMDTSLDTIVIVRVGMQPTRPDSEVVAQCDFQGRFTLNKKTLPKNKRTFKITLTKSMIFFNLRGALKDKYRHVLTPYAEQAKVDLDDLFIWKIELTRLTG